jgi:DMSO/TMAO reductase YedYZ molybdopterin-dependent catalytic subunit
MRHPGAEARRFRADGEGAGIQDLGPDNDTESAPDAAGIPAPRAATTRRAWTDREGHPRLPPGQYVQASMPVLHYGPVPTCNRQTWDLGVYGATKAGTDQRWSWDDFRALPRTEIIGDFHCVTKFSVLGITWLGVLAAEILRAVQASDRATHVMVWADFGYGANLPLDVFGAADTLLATHRDGRELSPEQGYPVRLVVPSRYGWKNVKWVRAIEYMIGDRRGFWEERGYHNNADPWLEQRYSYQELPGEGPPL